MTSSKSIVLKLQKRETLKIYYEFVKICVMNHKKFVDEIVEWMGLYVEGYKFQETLVFEKDLINILKDTDLSLTKMSLYNLRMEGLLVDSDNKPLWETDNFYVVYKLEPVLEIIKNRDELRKTRNSKSCK